MTAQALSLREFIRLEWRHGPRRAAAWMAAAGALLVALSHAIFPALPAPLIDFMERGFRLDDLAGVLLLNDLMAVYFPTFFFGLSSSLAVVLTAREERRLEILLAKPVHVADFVAARAFPALAGTAAVGLTTSLACALAVGLHAGAGSSVGPLGALGGGLLLTALSLVLVAALQLLFVRLRDPFQGLLVASLLWLTTSLPTALLLYRPDVYEGRPVLEGSVVMASLVWNADVAAWLGPLALAIALPLSALLTRAAGRLLERSDAV